MVFIRGLNFQPQIDLVLYITCGTVAKVFKLFCFFFSKEIAQGKYIPTYHLVKSLCIIYQHLHEMIIGNSGAIFLMKNNCFLPDSFVGRVYFCILKIFLKKFKFYLF